MILEDKVSVLILVSDEDSAKISGEILMENVTIETTNQYRDKLLTTDFDTVIVTKNYVRTHGETLVKNIIKLLHVMTRAKIHYLLPLNELSVDEISVYMRSLGINNIGRVDLAKLDSDTFRSMVRTNALIKPKKQNKYIQETDLNLLENQLRTLSMSTAEDFIQQNKGQLLDVINSYKSIAIEKDMIGRRLNSLIREADNYRNMSDEYLAKLNATEHANKGLRTELSDLRKFIMSEKSKIMEYNNRITNSTIVDNPIVTYDATAPIVIYFKELEDIGFFNFYQSILYSLRNIYKMNVKSVVLEKHDRMYYDPYSELDYATVPDNTRMETIIDNDNLVRFGNPTALLQNLAKPQFKLDIILIYDRVGTDTVAIQSGQMIPFYLGQKMSRVKTLTIDPISWISPKEGEWRNVAPLMSKDIENDQEMITYTTMVVKHPLMVYILNLIRF